MKFAEQPLQRNFLLVGKTRIQAFRRILDNMPLRHFGQMLLMVKKIMPIKIKNVCPKYNREFELRQGVTKI